MAVEFTMHPDDVTAARLLAIGVRPPLELSLFAGAVALLLACSISPWHFASLPLVIGLTAGLAAFRVMQIGKVKAAALAAFRRNPTLQRPTVAAWDEGGVTIEPAGTLPERILWGDIERFKENQRVFVLLQGGGLLHAIPKRAFPDKTALAAFRLLVRRHEGKLPLGRKP